MAAPQLRLPDGGRGGLPRITLSISSMVMVANKFVFSMLEPKIFSFNRFQNCELSNTTPIIPILGTHAALIDS
jgi:hypothetical protein